MVRFQYRVLFYRWRFLLIACLVTYCFVIYIPDGKSHRHQSIREKAKSEVNIEEPKIPLLSDLRKGSEFTLLNRDYKHKFEPYGESAMYVERVLTTMNTSLEERMSCKTKNEAPKLILSFNTGISQENLNGCPEWNCKITSDRKLAKKADALFITYEARDFKRYNDDQYLIYFSQESPVNAGYRPVVPDLFNMSLGFRHDSPVSSPYGYTVRLAPESRPKGQVVDVSRLEKKSKGAAWFVSHCGTNSKREDIVKMMQNWFPVDIYGNCGNHKCPRGGECEQMLDDDYHFYISFENSICKDYITEKLWNQGYQRDIIPIVLQRSIVNEFVPPGSFIAVDDFDNLKDLGEYLHYLMENTTAYAEYFEWRREYRVVFLNGKHHDVKEQPWGFCQVCRLLWETPLQHYSIPDFNEYWSESCEKDGTLARRIIQNSRVVLEKENKNKSNG